MKIEMEMVVEMVIEMAMETEIYTTTTLLGGGGDRGTSLTEVRHQMRSSELAAYLSLKCLSNGKVTSSGCYFV